MFEASMLYAPTTFAAAGSSALVTFCLYTLAVFGLAALSSRLRTFLVVAVLVSGRWHSRSPQPVHREVHLRDSRL